MQQVSPLLVLNTLKKHETLTIDDLVKEENLGMSSNVEDVLSALNILKESGLVNALDNVSPATYTITSKGIVEGESQDIAEK